MKQVWNNHISSAHCACRIPNTNKYQFRLSTARAQQAGWLPGTVPTAGSLKSSHVLTVPYFSRNKDCTGCNSTLQKADGSSKYWWVSPDVTVVQSHPSCISCRARWRLELLSLGFPSPAPLSLPSTKTFHRRNTARFAHWQGLL